ncbi:MAG: extracellular solute-binding protein [Fibrobacteres bacterium]|nr:extracellular solute-binding protein [Fibrobacterota bacterium]
MVSFITPPFENRVSKTRFFSQKPTLRRVLAQLFIIFAVTLSFSDLTILIKMIPEQEEWFKKEILEPYSKEKGVTVKIKRFANYNELDSMLQNDPEIDVVKIPMERSESYREKELIIPVSAIADSAETAIFRTDFMLPPLAVSERALYYIPRKLETRIMVYRVSKVKEAVEKYIKHLKDLDRELRKYRGKGMPDGYILEADPNQWDYYDILMAGYVWSKEDPKKPGGKIGHRGKNYPGTFLRLIDRSFQFGAIRGEISYLSSKPVVESFVWEGVYSKFNAYNNRMFKENWTGVDLWKTMGDNSIYLSFLTQLDCYFLIGTGENGLTGYMKTADDIDFAVMPAAASFTGEEFMLANRNITTGGWFWGISHKSASGRQALDLIKAMTSEENQKKEFEAFGVLSARRSLLKENRDELYLKRWRNRMLQTSIRQLNLNRFTFLPAYPDMERLQNSYYRLLYRLCVDNGDLHAIENTLGQINRMSETIAP